VPSFVLVPASKRTALIFLCRIRSAGLSMIVVPSTLQPQPKEVPVHGGAVGLDATADDAFRSVLSGTFCRHASRDAAEA